MMEKKKLLINCVVCDTRKMKEEDYAHFEKISLNTEMLVINDRSKGILNRLPVEMNKEKTIEIEGQDEIHMKTVNGSYEITGNTMVGEHTLMVVNGSLSIESGTEAILEKYMQIIVNGSTVCPKSMEGYLNKLTVNGSMTTYPDGYMLLDKNYVLDKYFPLRAKANGKYYVRDLVIIKDEAVDVSKLVSKNVQFITKTLLVPESKVEECASVFDEKTEFIVIPEGLKLVVSDKEIALDENFVRQEGSRLFIYGNVRIRENANMEQISNFLEKLIVEGCISIREEQMEYFEKLDVEYTKLEIIDNCYEIKNVVNAEVSCHLLKSSGDGVRIKNTAKVKIDEDVTPQMILEKLKVQNCAVVVCSQEQKPAVTMVAKGVVKIEVEGEENANGSGVGNLLGMMKSAASTKIINAVLHVM